MFPPGEIAHALPCSVPVPCMPSHDAESGQRWTNQDPSKASRHILPPLKSVCLPRIHPRHHYNLADQGWTTVTYDKPVDKLCSSFTTLLEASKGFFELPESSKEIFKTKMGSEEGWNIIEGEKEFITLRNLDNTPDDLKDAASAFWTEACSLLNEMLGCIANSLGLPAEALTVYSMPCKELSHERTATMLRLFRYQGSKEPETKIVAEAHKDLGLLSLVIGDSPGLEVWNRYIQRWFPLERTYKEPSGCLLVGRQLERLSNGRYMPGGHLVRSYPSPSMTLSQPSASGFTELNDARSTYRHSVVFVLRAHSPVLINTDSLTTNITGTFCKPLNGITAGELFKQIRNSHFNVNIAKLERETQRKKLADKNSSTVES